MSMKRGLKGTVQALLILTVLAVVSAAQTTTPKVIPAPPDVAAPPADATKTASGLASKVIKPGSGKDHPAKDDLVTIDYTGWKTDGTMFDSSVARGKPAVFPVGRVIQGFSEGLQLMVPGEKRRLWIPEALAYNVLKPGINARRPTASSTVTVHYTGWTTDGKMFDSSVTKGEPISFPLNGVIKGWTEGLQLMATGEKTRFWIPQELAYKGESAPYGMLVFDVELIKFE